MDKAEISLRSVFVGVSLKEPLAGDLDKIKDALVEDFVRVGEDKEKLSFTVRPKKEDENAPLIEVESDDAMLSVWVGERLIFLSAYERSAESLSEVYGKLSRILESDTFGASVVEKIRVADRGALVLPKDVSESEYLRRLSPLFGTKSDTDAASIQYSVSQAKQHKITYKYEVNLTNDSDQGSEVEFEALHVIDLSKDTTKQVQEIITILRDIDVEAEVNDGIERARKSLA